MKVTLEFDDHNEAAVYLKAPQLALALDEIYNKVRSYLKHQEPDLESAVKLLEEVKGLSWYDE